MENATKALLIAAAVLIVIVIIALGVRLLSAGGDSSEKASQVSQSLTSSTDDAITDMQGLLSGLPTKQ